MKAIDERSLSAALERLVRNAVVVDDYDVVFRTLCEELVEAGLPLLRCHLAMRTLHPLVESIGVTWIREGEFTLSTFEYAKSTTEQWQRSPFFWMLENGLMEYSWDLNDARATESYGMLQEIAALGGTQYLAFINSFGSADGAFVRQDGVITSWVTDCPGGFQQHHIEALQRVQPPLALVCKLAKQQYGALDVVSAYLGEDIGRRILNGRVRLGDVDRIPAVIWMSDMRNSTAMAEELDADGYLATLNDYFDCSAGAVLEQGGQVLSFIGDAVLAVFPIDQETSREKAACLAMEAASDASQRLQLLNRRRAEQALAPLAFGLGLHIGDVHYGNIGVPTRIDFSVIGRTVNEVSRLESLTKVLGEPLLVTREFADSLPRSWRYLGSFPVKGVSQGLEVLAPDNTP